MELTYSKGVPACASRKQRYVRPAPGFFAAIFSVAAQFDVRPLGWYNRRMEPFRSQGNCLQLSQSLLSSKSCGSSWPRHRLGLNGYEIPITGAVLNPQMRVTFPMKRRPASGLLDSLTLVVPCWTL